MADKKVITITVHSRNGTAWDMTIDHTPNTTCDEVREALHAGTLMPNEPDCPGVRRN